MTLSVLPEALGYPASPGNGVGADATFGSDATLLENLSGPRETIASLSRLPALRLRKNSTGDPYESTSFPLSRVAFVRYGPFQPAGTGFGASRSESFVG